MHVLRARDAEGGDAQHHQQADHDAKRIEAGAAQRRSVGLPPQRLQGTHIAQCDQWLEREHERNPDTHENAGEQRRRLERDTHVHRKKVGEHVGKPKLQRNAEHAAECRADEPHCDGLKEIHREHLTARCAETAENGHRVDLAHDERVHAARHADAPEQQRHETDDAQKVAKLVDGLREIEFRLRRSAKTHLRFLEARLESVDEARRRELRCELEQRAVLGPAAEQQQRRLIEVLSWNEDAWPDRGRDADVARHAQQRSGDGEARKPEGDRVSDVRVERHEQRGIDKGKAPFVEMAPRAGRLRENLPVERIPGRYRFHLCEPRESRARRQCH